MGDTLHADIRFSIVPQWLLEADISDRAIRIYGLIASYADNETHTAFPSRDTLARRARCHVKTVDRAIVELVEAGAIEKQNRKNGDAYTSNLYTVKRVSPGRDNRVPRVGTPTSPGRDTSVSLTRTNELEPMNQTHLTKSSKITADDYKPTDEFLQKLATEYPGVRLEVELEKFRDHHMANGSSFKIWDRAFRKWIRQASDWSPEARAARVRAEEEAKFEQWKRENGE